MQNTILVADSDTNMLLLLFRLFAEAGYMVTSASDGAEAIAKVRREGGRVVAVGTTSARVLEARGDASGCVRAGSGETDPGHRSSDPQPGPVDSARQ